MRRSLLYPVVLLLASACASSPDGHHAAHHHAHSGDEAASSGPSLIKWNTLAEGKSIAQETKKPMIVDFYVDAGCVRCERMVKYVYSDADIAGLMNTEFVPIRIDLARELTREERELGETYDYKHDCLLLFLDFDGTVIKAPGGNNLCFADYVGPDWFMGYLRHIMKRARKE